MEADIMFENPNDAVQQDNDLPWNSTTQIDYGDTIRNEALIVQSNVFPSYDDSWRSRNS